jgi:hypothetical protein
MRSHRATNRHNNSDVANENEGRRDKLIPVLYFGHPGLGMAARQWSIGGQTIVGAVTTDHRIAR